MSELEQVPFDGVDFAENPEPPLSLPAPARHVGVDERQEDRRVEHGAAGLCRPTPGGFDGCQAGGGPPSSPSAPCRRRRTFVTADAFRSPRLVAIGDTPWAPPSAGALAWWPSARRRTGRTGSATNRPWVFLITDGAPTDDVGRRRQRRSGKGRPPSPSCSTRSASRGPTWTGCAAVSVRQPLALRGLSFRELFVWLSNSLGSVSRSQPGEAAPSRTPWHRTAGPWPADRDVAIRSGSGDGNLASADRLAVPGPARLLGAGKRVSGGGGL